MRKIYFYCLIILGILLNTKILHAQGDGPRNLLWGPTGVTAVNAKWMIMNQNITPGNILIQDADIHIDVFPVTLIHNFGLGKRFAQLMFSAVPGSANGKVVPDPPGVPSPEVTASGFADGFIGLKIGLINQPALNVLEFSKHKQAFSMMFYTRYWYSGSYDMNKPLNLGSNRATIEFGFPMNMQFSANPKRATWLEVYPAMHLYTTNYDPTLITQADKTQQLPLFSLENHLSHNFTDKVWAGVDLRFQYGGAIKLDGVKEDNTINILGGGIVAGYQVLPFLGFSGGYNLILAGDNGAESQMLRFTVVFAYANTKKLKE